MTEQGQPNNPEETKPLESKVPAPQPTPDRPPVVVNTPEPSANIADAIKAMSQHLAAMPERVVDGLREATPKPAENPPAQPTATQPAQPAAQPKSRRERFHDFWFGA